MSLSADTVFITAHIEMAVPLAACVDQVVNRTGNVATGMAMAVQLG